MKMQKFTKDILKKISKLTFRKEIEMERRTQPGYEYHSCDFMDDGVYIDMNLLREYEDTGLIPEQIRELKERDTAKAVDNRTIIKNFSGAPLAIMGDCPSCGCENIKSCNTDFCPACGQRLQWEED